MPTRTAPARRPTTRVHGSVGVELRRVVQVMDSEDEWQWGITEESATVAQATAELPIGTRNMLTVAIARAFNDLGPTRARRLFRRLAQALTARRRRSYWSTAAANSQ